MALINLSENNTRNYGLDVVRCLAVAMVWIMHSLQVMYKFNAPYSWYISLGGVELFFSLSGFLIGRILLNVFLNDAFRSRDIVSFWIRRWFRILPLYYILYLSYLLLYNIFFHHVNFNFSFLVFLQNVWEPPSFFVETWSLTIEEWFYLSAPLIIFTFYSMLLFLGKKRRASAAFLLAAISLIVVMITFRQSLGWNATNNYGLAFRMDAIAYGLLAAYVSHHITSVTKTVALKVIVLGIFIWLIAIVIRMDHSILLAVKTFYYPLCGIGTSLFVLGMFYYPFTNRFSFITYISIRSYSIYLIHLTGVIFPLSVFSSHLKEPFVFILWIISFPLTLAICNLSFKYIELPLLNLRNVIAPKKSLRSV